MLYKEVVPWKSDAKLELFFECNKFSRNLIYQSITTPHRPQEQSTINQQVIKHILLIMIIIFLWAYEVSYTCRGLVMRRFIDNLYATFKFGYNNRSATNMDATCKSPDIGFIRCINLATS